MKYNLPAQGYLNKKERLRIFFRWLSYAVLLILLNAVMSSGASESWMPVLIIPAAIAVAMHEREFQSAVLGLAAGMLIDLASGHMFGMSSIWLMPCCLFASLLVMNLISVNVVNHLWLSAAACLIMGFMDYLFNYVIWDTPNASLVLTGYVLPAYASAAVLSPLLYYLVKLISTRLREKETRELGDIVESTEEDYVKEKI